MDTPSLKERNLQAVRKYREKLGKEEYLRRVLQRRIDKGHKAKQSTLLRYNLLGTTPNVDNLGTTKIEKVVIVPSLKGKGHSMSTYGPV
jgi:hypothetical protein